MDVKLTALLADAAKVDATGKVGLLGAGWVRVPLPTPPHALVALLTVPVPMAPRSISFRAELVDADGRPVLLPGAPRLGTGPAAVPIAVGEPLVFQMTIDLPAADPSTAGDEMSIPVVVELAAGLPLTAGRYEWRLSLDGVGGDSGRLAFTAST